MPNYDDLAQALASEGAAFGVFPQMGGRRRLQDAEAAKNIPVDILGGIVSTGLGAIPSGIKLLSDIRNAGRDDRPSAEIPGGIDYWLDKMPFKGEAPVNKAAAQLGSMLPINPAPAYRALGNVGKTTTSLLGNELARGMYGNEGSLANVIPTAMKPKQIFIGENAKTWNKDAAQTAVEMEKAGAKPEDIWSSTGTFRGAEGKLRQEISDIPAVLRENQLPQAPSLLSVATQYLRDKGVITNPNRDIASIGVSEELRKEAIDYAKNKLQQMELPKTLLGNVFEHPELLKAYPDLANIKVGKETSSNYRGMYNPEENTITTGGGLIGNADQSRSTMLHELQHAIQEKEGMAKGGNPTVMPNIIRKQWSEELEPLQEANSKFRGNLMRLQSASGQQYLNKLDKLSVADNIKPSQVFRFSDWYKYSGDIHDALGKMPTRKSFARDEWLRRASQIMKQKVVEEKPYLLDYKLDEREANNLYKAASRGLDKTRKEAQAFDNIQRKYQELYKMPNEESYMHLAGEAEARATQERLPLSEQERLAKYPYESYDRPKNKLLITK